MAHGFGGFVFDLDAADLHSVADGEMGNSAAILAEIGDVLDSRAGVARSSLHVAVAPEALDVERDKCFPWTGHGQLLSVLVWLGKMRSG